MSDYTAKRIDDLEAFYGGLFLKARDELGVQSFGMAIVELSEGREANYPMHDHGGEGQEEVYVVLRGGGRMKLDDEIVELRAWDAVRVAPGTWRGYEAGAEGLEILVIGAPNLGDDPRGDVEGRRDWWGD